MMKNKWAILFSCLLTVSFVFAQNSKTEAPASGKTTAAKATRAPKNESQVKEKEKNQSSVIHSDQYKTGDPEPQNNANQELKEAPMTSPK